eukprot:snap_masked-scaffold_85-processed-gene-0.27-mRNA-1 protein AED:1.00 eAED:1.00 QI:0/-1/0/0/-1/1/1/0/99
MEQKLGETNIKVDNQGTLKLLNGQTLSEKSRHMDMKYFYSRNGLKKNKWKIDYVPGNNNPADVFTKLVAQDTFIKTMKMMLTNKGKEKEVEEREEKEKN